MCLFRHERLLLLYYLFGKRVEIRNLVPITSVTGAARDVGHGAAQIEILRSLELVREAQLQALGVHRAEEAPSDDEGGDELGDVVEAERVDYGVDGLPRRAVREGGEREGE